MGDNGATRLTAAADNPERPVSAYNRDSPFDELRCSLCKQLSHIDSWQTANGDETDDCECPRCRDWSRPIHPLDEEEEDEPAQCDDMPLFAGVNP